MKINKRDYTDFIKKAKYDYENKFIGEENKLYFGKSIKEFCDRQKEKFEKKDENKYGCCLNYSLYLLSKYDGLFMTCKDKPLKEGGQNTIHCAFIYEDDGKLFVADSAMDKIE